LGEKGCNQSVCFGGAYMEPLWLAHHKNNNLTFNYNHSETFLLPTFTSCDTWSMDKPHGIDCRGLGACYSTKKKEEIGCIITFWLSKPTCSGCQFNGSTLNELVVDSILPLSQKNKPKNPHTMIG